MIQMSIRTASIIPPYEAIDCTDVRIAANRISGMVRRVTLASVDPATSDRADVFLAYEFTQHTGSFKARGAANLATYHLDQGRMPEAGVVIASGGNAGLACAWAAKATSTKATVFLPATAPLFKVAKLIEYGADVRLVGTEYAHALDASTKYASASGALHSHAYDHPLIAAGAGTVALEIIEEVGNIDTVIVAVGGGGLFSGIAAAVMNTGIRVVAVEPENCRAFNTALDAGGPVDVSVNSIAADSLGARRTSQMAYELAQRLDVTSALVPDEAISRARQLLWDQRRIVVENGAAAALAALLTGVYVPKTRERVVVVLCGANTDPADLVHRNP